MNFRVEPTDIEGFGKLVDRAAEDMVAAIKYLGNAKLEQKGSVGELWEQCSQEHDKYVSDGKAVLERIQTVLDSAATELASSARYYKGTDRSQAAAIDSTYPGSKGRGTGGAAPSPNGFADVSDAGGQLKPPPGENGYLGGHLAEYQFSPVTKTIGTVMDFGSPSAMANEGIKLLFGIDIYGEALKWVTGDWDGYTQCGETWANLGSCCKSVSENIKAGNELLESSWDGNAADTAWVYFDELAKKAGGVEEGFTSLRHNYDAIAHLIFSVAEFLKAGLAWIVDRVIMFVLFNAAAVAAAATVVGAWVAPANAVIAATQAAMAITKWGEMVAGLTQTALALNGVLLVGSGIAAKTLSSVKDFPEVGGNYDHRAV